MIFYATKETMNRYKLTTPEKFKSEIGYLAQAIAENERGNRLYEWGCKLFYFDGKKSIQIVHFASKLTIFLINLKKNEIEFAANAIAQYIFDIYSDDKKMKKALEKYYESSPCVVFDKLVDKSIIATLNSTQRYWAFDGYRFYDYIEDGILHTKEINVDINDFPFTRKVEGKTEYYEPKGLFRKIILENFG